MGLRGCAIQVLDKKIFPDQTHYLTNPAKYIFQAHNSRTPPSLMNAALQHVNLQNIS